MFGLTDRIDRWSCLKQSLTTRLVLLRVRGILTLSCRSCKVKPLLSCFFGFGAFQLWLAAMTPPKLILALFVFLVSEAGEAEALQVLLSIL